VSFYQPHPISASIAAQFRGNEKHCLIVDAWIAGFVYCSRDWFGHGLSKNKMRVRRLHFSGVAGGSVDHRHFGFRVASYAGQDPGAGIAS
jgi:hypothetical protein